VVHPGGAVAVALPGPMVKEYPLLLPLVKTLSTNMLALQVGCVAAVDPISVSVEGKPLLWVEM
jgi:hypothetical protein